jgi:hypothetical protein
MAHSEGSMKRAFRRCLTAAVAVALPAAVPLRGGAQVYSSERGLVAQTVNGTTFTVEYYRPKARGRELFGKLVRWGQPWTPGANWATTLEVDHDVQLEGQPLPKGKYSVWAIPNPDAWTVYLYRKARVFHTLRPGADDEQLHVTVKPVQGPHVEALTWTFPVMERNAAELHLQWGTTDVPLRFGIGPTAGPTLGEQQRAAYTGVYSVTHLDPRSRIRSSTYTVFDSAGVLRLRRERAPDQLYDAQYDLSPTGEHRFVPIMYKDGALVGVEPAMTVIFTVEGAHATAVEVRGPGGGAMVRGTLEHP